MLLLPAREAGPSAEENSPSALAPDPKAADCSPLAWAVNPNAVALIIGVEKYTNAPDANYANLDAKFFAEYAKKAFGVKS